MFPKHRKRSYIIVYQTQLRAADEVLANAFLCYGLRILHPQSRWSAAEAGLRKGPSPGSRERRDILFLADKVPIPL